VTRLVLHQAGFLVVPRGAGVERRRQRLGDHLLLLQCAKRGVESFALIQVLEHGLGQLVHKVLGHVRPGHQRRLDAERLDVLIVAGIVGLKVLK